MNNDIVERALKLYVDAGLPKENLFTDISTYVRLHYVYAAPDALILARIEYGNWYVELAVGNMVQFFNVAPFKTPWIGYARRGKPARWFNWDHVEKLVRRYDSSKLQRQCTVTTADSGATNTNASGSRCC